MSIAILGGGLTGLTAAYRVSRGSVPFQLYEASTRFGGWVKSRRDADGTFWEDGPRSVRVDRAQSYEMFSLIDSLGLTDAVVPLTRPARQLLLPEGLVRLPRSFKELRRFRVAGRSLLRAALRDLRPRTKGSQSLTVDEFLRRRYGSEVATYMGDAVVRGIYAGSSREIALSALMPHLAEEGSLWGVWRSMKNDENVTGVTPTMKRALKERWSAFTFQEGVAQLTDSLVAGANVNNSLHTSMKCVSMKLAPNAATLTFSDGSETEVSHVISTLPHHALTALLPDLPHLTSASVTLVHVKFPASVTQVPADSFGYLVPSVLDERLLGAIFNDASLPCITAMTGGTDMDDVVLIPYVLSRLKTHLGITEEPLEVTTKRCENAITQYTPSHKQTVRECRRQLAGLPISICGSSFDGVSLNHCVRIGALAGEFAVMGVAGDREKA